MYRPEKSEGKGKNSYARKHPVNDLYCKFTLRAKIFNNGLYARKKIILDKGYDYRK